MAWDYCDKCGKRTSDKQMWDRLVCGATHSAPAEYERQCYRTGCAPQEERDEAYERAAARFDCARGERDWR